MFYYIGPKLHKIQENISKVLDDIQCSQAWEQQWYNVCFKKADLYFCESQLTSAAFFVNFTIEQPWVIVIKLFMLVIYKTAK